MFLVATLAMSLGYAKYYQSRTHNPYDLQDGDIVFQSCDNSQGKAVKAATNSRWTHVGLVFFQDEKPMVIEAGHPVKISNLSNFIARSPESFYAMRLKEADQHIDAECLVGALLQLDGRPDSEYDRGCRGSRCRQGGSGGSARFGRAPR